MTQRAPRRQEFLRKLLPIVDASIVGLQKSQWRFGMPVNELVVPIVSEVVARFSQALPLAEQQAEGMTGAAALNPARAISVRANIADMSDPLDPQAFGRTLRNIRLDAGLKQAELAEAVGVSQAMVSSWETGKAVPSSHFKELGAALNKPYQELVDLCFNFSNPVERAIVADKSLTRKEQNALLAHYGAASGRDSLKFGELLRNGWEGPEKRR